MAEDWLADVRKYDAGADEGVVAAIVRYCGIALRTRDASLVSFSDRKETDRVRENYLRKKLALTDDDATLDAAIAAVGERMKADRTKNRVTVYYLLADRFDRLGLYGGTARAAPAASAAIPAAGGVPAAGAAPLAAMSAAAASAPSGSAPVSARAAQPVANVPAARSRQALLREGDGVYGFGCLAAGLLIGLILLAAVVGGMFGRDRTPAVPPAPPADFSVPATTAPPTAAPAVPEGAGVIAAERDAKPMLTVYFDTGKAVVTPDFGRSAAPLLAYLQQHPGARVAISGYNDPTGNAALNAELSKNRAKAVGAALAEAGVAAGRIDLVKPADTTTNDVTPAEARRVEVTVVDG